MLACLCMMIMDVQHVSCLDPMYAHTSRNDQLLKCEDVKFDADVAGHRALLSRAIGSDATYSYDPLLKVLRS